MGIDIYARWKDQTPKQKKKQITGFSVTHGNVGYLREAYRGEHYATRYLCREAFDKNSGEAKISAKLLRERLPRTLEVVEKRERTIYKQTDQKEIDKVKQSFIDFVELCELKEKETGEPCTITASY